MNTFLSAPINIGKYTARNRIVVPPMANFNLAAKNGLVTSEHLTYYKSYVDGGAGVVIVEACSIIPPPNTIEVFDDNCIPGLNQLADVICSNGAIGLVQLLHEGIKILQEDSISQISREDFLKYKQLFIEAALRCKKAGFHGVELHAAHGFYLNQVIEKNTRDDEYGGSFENRIRLIQELILEIKKVCGHDFIAAVRFGNSNYNELISTATAIEQAGGDLLDVSTGFGEYHNIPNDFEFDSKIYAASLVKKHVTIPVIGVGNIFNGEQAEKILENGYSDMVAVGRGHLCDSAWARKAINEGSPILCRNCRTCMWYIDSNKCPAKNRK